MGLIKAAISSAKTTLADQWLEYFYCDSLSDDVLVKKASKRVDAGSNTKGSPDVITNGSGIAVNEGQAMLIVEDGKVVDFTVEPGRFTLMLGGSSEQIYQQKEIEITKRYTFKM